MMVREGRKVWKTVCYGKIERPRVRQSVGSKAFLYPMTIVPVTDQRVQRSPVRPFASRNATEYLALQGEYSLH